MTIISEKRLEPSKNARSRNGKLVYVMRCDTCLMEFEKWQNLKGARERPNHYCSPGCYAEASRSGNFVDEKKKETNRKIYGIDYKFASSEIAKLGSSNAWKDEAKKKRQETIMNKYGVEHIFNIPRVREANKSKSNSPESIVKCKSTMMQRYGVSCMFLLPRVKQNSQKSRNTPESWIKRWETHKKNGSMIRSKPEMMFYEILCEKFGKEDVEQWLHLNGWSIDLYVKSIDTYIQVDGVYWHGLDRPIENIKASSRPRDTIISRKYDSDRRQDTWFKENGLRLVRITDLDVKRLGKEALNFLHISSPLLVTHPAT